MNADGSGLTNVTRSTRQTSTGLSWSPRQTKGNDPLREEKRKKARLVTLAAVAEGVTLAAVAAARLRGSEATRGDRHETVAAETFVLHPPLQAAHWKRDTGTISHDLLSISGHDVMRDGQESHDLQRRSDNTHREARSLTIQRRTMVDFRAGREWRR